MERLARADFSGAAEADRALLRYAVKLTRHPASIGPPDIQDLRSNGFDDRAIHDLCQVVSYFGYVNRVADGLGVELEARFADPTAR